MNTNAHSFDPYAFLRDLCFRYRDLPAQGTRAWREARKSTVGGSEASTVLRLHPEDHPHKNKYNTPVSLINSKLGRGGFKGSPETFWGNITEPLTRMWVAEHYRCEIHELGTLPGKIEGQTFSGDGFGVVRTPWLTRNGRRFHLDELVVFEFKSLTRRMHKFEFQGFQDEGNDNNSDSENNTDNRNNRINRKLELVIPPYYLPQIQVGLLTVPEAAYAVFAEALIRRCDVGSLDYSPVGICADFGPQELPAQALGYGIIGFRWRGRPPPIATAGAKKSLSAGEVEALVSAMFETEDDKPASPEWVDSLTDLWRISQPTQNSTQNSTHNSTQNSTHNSTLDCLVDENGLELLEVPEMRLLNLARIPSARFSHVVQAVLDDEHEFALEPVYPLTSTEAPAETLRRLRAECVRTNSEVFGVLGFKLFSLYMRPVERDEGFRDLYEPLVRRFIEVLRWARAQPELPPRGDIQRLLRSSLRP